MDLKSLLLPERVVTFDFPGCDGMTIDLAFLSKESNQQLWKRCQRPKIDPKTRQPKDEFDENLFLELYTKAVVKGWDGFKYKYLNELVIVDIPEDLEEDFLEYTESNALELVKSSNIFDNWVGEVVSDISNFSSNSSKKKSKKSRATLKKVEQA